jgi:hypothetical protein
MRNANKMLITKVEGNRSLEPLDVDGRTTLIYIKQQGVWVWTVFDWIMVRFNDDLL